MFEFSWSNDDISLVLTASKELLNPNKNEEEDDFSILLEKPKFVKYLRTKIEGNKTIGERLLIATLNRILNEEGNEKSQLEEMHYFDVTKWLPHATLAEFQKSFESACFIIESKERDLSEEKGVYKNGNLDRSLTMMHMLIQIRVRCVKKSQPIDGRYVLTVICTL